MQALCSRWGWALIKPTLVEVVGALVLGLLANTGPKEKPWSSPGFG